LDASCLARDERASARLLLFQFVGYLPLYIGTIKPNCDDFDEIRRIGRFDHHRDRIQPILFHANCRLPLWLSQFIAT
jgi:hypothetical protein